MGLKMDHNYIIEERKKFVGTLPEKIQKRVQVLFSLNQQYEDIKKKYDEREIAIHVEFEKEMAPFYARRRAILSGEEDATEEEVKGGFPEDHEGKVNTTLDENTNKEESPVGLKNFWLTVLKNHMVISPLIEEEDESLLSHLIDLNSCVTSGNINNFRVTFTFRPNEYIKETELTLSLTSTEKGTEIEKSPITFSKSDFLFRKVPVQKKKGKGKGPTMKKVPRPSFFRIFKEDNEDDDEVDEDGNDVDPQKEQISSLLYVLHYKVVPSAINYFTGERDGLSDFEEEDYEEEEEEDEEDGDDDQEEEE